MTEIERAVKMANEAWWHWNLADQSPAAMKDALSTAWALAVLLADKAGVDPLLDENGNRYVT